MKSNILRKLSGILMFIIGIPLVLADEETEDIIGDTFRPSLEVGILGLPIDIRTLLTWAISVAFVFAVFIIIIYTFYDAIRAWWSGRRRDSTARSTHIGNVFYGAIVLFVMIIAILLIIFIASGI